MSLSPNSASLWNNYWKQVLVTRQSDSWYLLTEAHSIRWQRMRQIIDRELGGIKGRQVIELGAGVGTFSALMTKYKAKATVVDYSDEALKKARHFFKHNNLRAKFVKADVLDLPTEFKGQFNISISVGLTEHFKGKKRLKINRAHFEVLKPGGLALILVPNAWNLPYRIFKFIFERTGRWEFGEEYPYSRVELRTICCELGIKRYGFFGERLWNSLRFVNPFQMSRKLNRLVKRRSPPVYKKLPMKLKNETGTWLDSVFGFSLGLWALKP